MIQATHGSLPTGLEIDRAESLLIRGGTSSISMAALSLAKQAELTVGTTTCLAHCDASTVVALFV